MALPPKIKTWQYNVNQVVYGASEPSTTPPSGDPVLGITIIGIWEV